MFVYTLIIDNKKLYFNSVGQVADFLQINERFLRYYLYRLESRKTLKPERFEVLERLQFNKEHTYPLIIEPRKTVIRFD